MAYLYVILSHTTTGAGKLIRTFTRSYYNHVSLSLHENLSQIVSFARISIDTPMHAGYIPEPPERFLYAGPVPVRVFRVEISEEKARSLVLFFQKAGDRSIGLLYNYFAALVTPLRLRCPIPGAYTCLGFASAILNKPYRSIQELEQDLMPMLFYEGPLENLQSDSGDRSFAYFTPRGFLRGTGDSIVHMSRLIARSTRLKKFDDPVKELSRV